MELIKKMKKGLILSFVFVLDSTPGSCFEIAKFTSV
jgi:hypothetical protein